MGTYPFATPAAPPSGTAGGDLSGTYPNPEVAQSSAAPFSALGGISSTYYYGGNIVTEGTIDVQVAGNGLLVAEGSNAKQGTVILNGTTAVVVANTSVTASSRIFLTINTPGGTPGSPYVSARSAGVSFSVKSTGAADTSTAAYEIFEPG